MRPEDRDEAFGPGSDNPNAAHAAEAVDHVAEELAPDLSGDLGVSSGRTTMSGIEGTGTLASAQGRTDGASPTHPGEELPRHLHDEPGVPAGELTENPAEVPSHESDPASHPGHSHG